MDGADALRLRRWCQEEANLLLPGAGLGFLLPPGAPNFQEGFSGSDAFRIGHMGYLNPPMLLGTLATIDCAFKALQIHHSPGAVCAASQVLASSWAELAKLKGDTMSFTAWDQGPSSSDQLLAKKCSALKVLELKVGAQVVRCDRW